MVKREGEEVQLLLSSQTLAASHADLQISSTPQSHHGSVALMNVSVSWNCVSAGFIGVS